MRLVIYIATAAGVLTNCSSWIPKKDLDEWVETVVKGPGYFQWEAKEYEFRLHQDCPVAPAIGRRAQVWVGDRLLIDGVVDRIRERGSKVPIITVFPSVVNLKDVKAGSETQDSSGRFRWAFRLEEGVTVQRAVETVLESYTANKDSDMPDVDWQVSVPSSSPEDDQEPVPVWAPHGIVSHDEALYGYRSAPLNLFTPVEWMDVDGPEDLVQVKLIEGIGGAPNAVLLGVRQWYTQGGNSGYFWLAARFGAEGMAEIPTNIYPGSTYWDEWQGDYPLDAFELRPNYTGTAAAIPDELAIAQTREVLGGVTGELQVVAKLATPNGVWTFVSHYNESAQHLTVYPIWWSDPTVQTIQGNWINRSILDVIKDIALVSGRWLKAVGNQITLVRRDSWEVQVEDPAPGLIASRVTEERRESPPEVSLELYTVVDLQSAASDEPPTGIFFTPGQLHGLNWWYTHEFAGIQHDTEVIGFIEGLPESTRLLAYNSDGVLMELAFAIDGRRFRYQALKENAA